MKIISSELLIISLLTISTSTYSQMTTLRGVVTDTLGNPLEAANVVALNSQKHSVVEYSITNDKGEYSLRLPSRETYDIQVSYIGFESNTIEVFVAENKKENTYNIQLKEENNILGEAQIVYEIPIIIKGDTIVYNSDFFTSGKERKLKDVLDKLPGVEVNNNGDIEVEGKTVERVMIEGKKFFDGDSKLAAENIPANSIEKVEVIKNYNDVAQIKGLEEDDDNIALNIKLKKGKTNFWFGDITARASINDLYLFRPKVFHYSPKHSLNVIGNINNIGEIPFTIQDYFKFSGGIKKNASRKSRTQFSEFSNLLGFNFLKNNKASSILSKFAGINYDYHSLDNNWDISTYAIFNESRVDMVTHSYITFIDNNLLVEDYSSIFQKNQLGLFKLSLGYNPNDNFQFDYNGFVKTSKQKEYQYLDSSVKGLVNTSKKEIPYSFDQNINIYATLDDKNVISASISYFYGDQAPNFEVDIDESPFSLIPVDSDQSRYQLGQNQEIITHKLDTRFDYYYLLSSNSNLKITLANALNIQLFESKMYQILDDNSYIYFENQDLNNDVTMQLTDTYLALEYKILLGKFTLTPGVSVHYYINYNEQLETKFSRPKASVLADLYAKYEIGSSESISFKYNVINQFSNINQLAQGYVFKNYNLLNGGNRYLENAQYYNYNLNYMNFNLFSLTNIFINLNYIKRYNDIKNRVEINGIDQVSSSINSIFSDESIKGYIYFEKGFGKFKFSLSSQLDYSVFNNIVNSDYAVSNYFSQNYQIRTYTNFKQAPNFELGYSRTWSENDLAREKVTFITDRPFAKVDFTFLKVLTLDASFNFYKYRDKNQAFINNRYAFLDSNLYYKKDDSPWEFAIKVTNLLDTKSLNDNSFNESFTTTSIYEIQPRFITLSLSYNL